MSRRAPLLLALVPLLLVACDGRSGPGATPAVPPAAAAPAPAAPAAGAAASATVQSLDAGLKPAFELANAGRFDDARAAVSEYSRGASAREYQAEFILGYSFQKQKVYASASEHLRRSVELAPDYHPPWHFLGFARYYLGDLAGAREAFAAHLRFVPDEGDSWFGLGIVDLDEDRLDDAEREFRKAIELHTAVMQRDPAGRARAREVAKSRARLADVLMRREQWEPARAELQQATQLWPTQPDVWHKLHDVLLRLGDAAGADEALRHRDEVRAQLGRAGAASEDDR